jgi:hypothetical protein
LNQLPEKEEAPYGGDGASEVLGGLSWWEGNHHRSGLPLYVQRTTPGKMNFLS